MLLLGWHLLLGGRFADELCQPFSSEAVLGRSYAVHKTLTGHIWTVQQLVYVHRGEMAAKTTAF